MFFIRLRLPAEVRAPVGHHVRIKIAVGAKPVLRPYTPIGPLQEKTSYLDFLIKTYEAPAGVMSRALGELKPGAQDSVTVNLMDTTTGGLIDYIKTVKGVKHLRFLTAGTGITPCIRILRQWLADHQAAWKEEENIQDSWTLKGLFSYKTQDDTLCQDLLDS